MLSVRPVTAAVTRAIVSALACSVALTTHPVHAQATDRGTSAVGVPLDSLTVRARLTRTRIVSGAALPLELHVRLTPRARRSRRVPDPREGGDAMSLWIRTPSGDVRRFTTGEALETPGVQRPTSGMQLVPGQTRVISLDLAQLTDVRAAGRYAVLVTYRPLAGGETWQSDTLRLVVTARTARPLPASTARTPLGDAP